MYADVRMVCLLIETSESIIIVKPTDNCIGEGFCLIKVPFIVLLGAYSRIKLTQRDDNLCPNCKVTQPVAKEFIFHFLFFFSIYKD